MFHFKRKDKDKESDKKEKHEKKKKEKEDKLEKREREKHSLTSEEMSRLDEVRNNLFRRFSDREKKRTSLKNSTQLRSTVKEESARASSEEYALSSTVGRTSNLAQNRSSLPHLTKQSPLLSSSSTTSSSKPALKDFLKGKWGAARPASSVDMDGAKTLRENIKCNEDLFISQLQIKTADRPVSDSLTTSLSHIPALPAQTFTIKIPTHTTGVAEAHSTPTIISSSSSSLSSCAGHTGTINVPPISSSMTLLSQSKIVSSSSSVASESHSMKITPDVRSQGSVIHKPMHPTSCEDVEAQQLSATAHKSSAFGDYDYNTVGESEKTFSFESQLKLPVVVPAKPPRMREIQIERSCGAGFGFSLRKAVIPSRGSASPRVITFAEPRHVPNSASTGLMPGDRLVEVNGINVESTSREEIAEMIGQSGNTLTLKVQPIQELIELSIRPDRSGTSLMTVDRKVENGSPSERRMLPANLKKASSDKDVKSSNQWQEVEKVWLVHRGGFSQVSLLQPVEGLALPEGRVRVKLESGDVVEVDEDDIEKINPPQCDRVEDLASLRYLNESSVLHTLRQRFACSLIHTFAGPFMIVVNPMQQLPVYADKIVHMLKSSKSEEAPPHIYSMAQLVYRDMMNSRQDQSIVLMGRSGSGKTVSAQHVLRHLVTAAGSIHGVLTTEKLNSVYIVLHAFGNCRTATNINASRFTQLCTVNFDSAGQIASAVLQTLMLEKTRVVRRPEGEQTFTVLYLLLAAADSVLRHDLQLQSVSEANLFLVPLQKTEEKEKAAETWSKLMKAFTSLSFTENEVKAVLSVLAAIVHLGNAGAVKGANNRAQFAKPAAAQKAAMVLGTTLDELSKAIFTTSGATTLARTSSLRVAGVMDRPTYLPSDSNATAQESLEAFVMGLYADLFSAIVSLINRSLSSTVRSVNSITILDCPGFQSSGVSISSGRNSGATFEDLCHNYTQERLQAFFHELSISAPVDKYEEENIEVDVELTPLSPTPLISLLDKPPQQSSIRSTGLDNKNSDKKGLLWILEEEAMFPGASEDSFMERLLQQHCEHPIRKDSLLRKGALGHTFVLNHNLATTPTIYNASGWLKASRENSNSRNAILILQDSKKPAIAQLFAGLKLLSPGSGGTSLAGVENLSSLQRVSSLRRGFTPAHAGLKKKSICLQVVFTVDSIVDMLKKTKVHFVHCVLPQLQAGLGEQPSPALDDSMLNVPLVRNQLRGFEILDALRLYRVGFPDCVLLHEFIHKFEPMVPDINKTVDHKLIVQQILNSLGVDKVNYRVGKSQVFFRSGCLTQLDLDRNQKLAGVIEQVQALCRGYLSRKKFEKLKIQHKAVRCIQRNVQKYFLTREWPWWRLFIKLKPLLNVHRTEEELRARETEVETLKAKLEKLETERTEFKVQCDRLELRLTEVSAELVAENTTSSQATEYLESETAERLRLEKEHRELQNKLTALKRQNEKLQMELVQTRLWQAESLQDNELEDKQDDSVYRTKYEKVTRELLMTKKQFQQQHQEQLEQELQARKQVEKKLHEAVIEAEEQRRQVQVAKKKSQRLASELQDLRLHLDEHTARNSELERKQRRFDGELNMAHEEAREERLSREKIQREKDLLLSEKYSLEQSLQQLRTDLQALEDKCERQDMELRDLLQTSRDNSEAVALKRSKQELEAKLQEQEEELDDQAGKIQQLEQVRLRLEMNLEKIKQQQQKELEEKDEEMEELRHKTHKRLKLLEDQLEEEYLQKKRAQEERVQIERQLQMSDSRDYHRDRETEKKLRRNLRRTKALLKDTGAALVKQREVETARAQVLAFRNQLEDAEFATAAALKAKKRLELEVQELQQQLDDVTRAKHEVESRNSVLQREKTDIESILEEVEEDYNEALKKYKAAVQQQSLDQLTLTDQLAQIEELLQERDRLKQEVSELQTRLQLCEETMVDRHKLDKLDMKVRDAESRLELEAATRHRLENQVSRLKEQAERVTQEKEVVSQARVATEEANKKLLKQLRDLREELGQQQKRELEVSDRKKELEARVEELESVLLQSQSDLKLAMKRITDLQVALEEELDTDSDLLMSDCEENESSDGSGLHTYLASHKKSSIKSQAQGLHSHNSRASRASET